MNNSIGIIGGADGPTAIMVSGNPVLTFVLIGAVTLLVGALIGFLIGFTVGRKKHK